MNTRIAIGICLAAVTAAPLTGCRVERTRGQRHQVRAIETVLQNETALLASSDAPADLREVIDRQRDLLAMYSDLVNAMVRSATAEPLRVQESEDELILLADEVRGLDTYRAWDPDTQLNFERQFWRNRLQPWQMWRGPGWHVKRESFTVRPGS